MTPIFFILHPSARPHKWREIYESWMVACDQPQFVEYVLCADERWGFSSGELSDHVSSILSGHNHPIRFKFVWNTKRRCYVDAVNTAAEASTGRILIVIADDQYPCENWDTRILNVLEKPVPVGNSIMAGWDYIEYKNDFVISVSTGTPLEHERFIMPMPILSRARYERKGYVFFPEYESAYADNDFYAEAERDGVIIDARRLMFPHRHPLAEPGAWEKRFNGQWINRDEAYAAQNSIQAYNLGGKIFARRWAGVAPISPQDNKNSIAQAIQDGYTRNRTPRSIALALPGETFHHVWVAKFAELVVDLMREGWNYAPLFIHTSEPGITRATIVKAILEMRDKGQFNPEFILWMDDDQIVEPQQVQMLMRDADQFPDVDLVAGWTWIASGGPHVNAPQVSCGRMDLDKGELSHPEYKSVQAANGVFEVGWTGFPLVLMRTSALDKVGKNPFSHWPCDNSPWGECGEDISFCKRLTDAGGKIYVDSRVFVPHLKLRALGPVPDSKEEIALALTGAMAAD